MSSYLLSDQLLPPLHGMAADDQVTNTSFSRFLTLVTVEKGPKPRGLAPCDPQAPKLLARILGQMGKLREVKLLLSSPSSLGARVRGELRRQKVSLPSTQTLIFGSPGLYPEMSARFIPAVFPNLTTLDLQVGKSLGKTPGLVKIAGLLPELRKLKLCKQSWESHDLHRVADLFPKIRYLLLKGSLKGMRVSVSHRLPRNAAPMSMHPLTKGQLQTLVPIFKRFSKLRNLVMTVEQYVEVQEQEGEDLTNDDYDFLISDLIQDHHLNENQAETALEFFKQCPRLYTVCLIREWDANRFVPVVEKGTDEVVGAKVATSWDEEDTKYWNSDGWPRISEMD